MYTHALVAKKLRAAVAGANGYAGMTAVHLLACHPGVELTQLTSRSYAGKPYSEVFPLLDLKGSFVPEPAPDGVDVIFSCLPHNVVDAKAGVSGAGRSLGLGVQFSEVNESLGAYGIEGHRHLAEIVQELSGLASPHPALRADLPTGWGGGLTFVPHLVPMTRGILATCYFDLRGSVGELQDAYREFYAGQPFTRVVDKTPATKLTTHSNLCLVNVGAQRRKAVVTAALDNLLKGASGQGIECFNIAFGFDRTTALTGALQWP